MPAGATTMRRRWAWPALVMAATVAASCGPGASAPSDPGSVRRSVAAPHGGDSAHMAWIRAHYDKTVHRVAMRDGVELHTLVYTPRDADGPVPVMLFRTPYSIAPYEEDVFHNPLGPSAEFDRAGYIFVHQDVRGKFRSDGDFEVIRPLAPRPRGPAATDESTDNWDTIEWVLRNVEGHNGRVGQWGISYPGWQTVMGMVDAHPALAASSPQASPADMFIGDDWHHNGAFRIMYAFSWLAGNARRRDAPTQEREAPFDYGTPWGYEFFLDAGSATDIDARYFHGDVPAWNDFIEHDTYDEYWQRQNALIHLDGVRHPVLNVAGWFDTEDFYGPMAIYRTLEERNPGIENTLVVGPWRHGGWRSMLGDHLGCIGFEDRTSERFQLEVQFPFFERHLRDAGGWSAPEAVVFETGSNRWRSHDRWPPPGTEAVSVYLQEGGRLSFEPPADEGADPWVSDPARPVPFSAEIRTTLGHLWKVEDQRFASTRPDVLVYVSEPLTDDLTIAGPILADLFVSTTGTDADWIVKVIDVFPGDAPPSTSCDVPMGGYQMLLAGEIMRGRFRSSFSEPEPMEPGRVTPIHIDLRDRYHTFRAGHRVMVHVQSSWFPAYDRNPQQYVDTYRARPGDYRPATHTLHRSPQYPSSITFGVLR